ncbi:hypothetical protein AVEN_74133-1 [Araneus ventricosus]|uniref:Uncharacterized protein n=1 Tax=Araneus ventricosus TaxID=182803 RepID=A0A4Y2V1J2_ARAVE|nr:hypothetical protein AVEN_74133-1 [Araneus ventricosus]
MSCFGTPYQNVIYACFGSGGRCAVSEGVEQLETLIRISMTKDFTGVPILSTVPMFVNPEKRYDAGNICDLKTQGFELYQVLYKYFIF